MRFLLLLLIPCFVFGQTPTIDSLIPASTYLKGSLVLSSGKTATINGTTATVSSQTDSTAIVVGRLRNGLQDTISLTAGVVSDSTLINSKIKGNKITWKTK